jgi:hypothetical protein
MDASSALKSNWAIHHPTRTTGMLGANATMRMPTEPPTRPMTIHGRRMPRRDAVRSLIRPKNGLPNNATRAPIPATSARLLGARSIPTSESTFNARVTSSGARNSRLVLMYANVYSDTKPHPTLREIQSSRTNLNLVYTQVNENTFLIATLRPIGRRDKYAQQTRRGNARVAPSLRYRDPL